jgi:hypothetical protein
VGGVALERDHRDAEGLEHGEPLVVVLRIAEQRAVQREALEIVRSARRWQEHERVVARQRGLGRGAEQLEVEVRAHELARVV